METNDGYFTGEEDFIDFMANTTWHSPKEWLKFLGGIPSDTPVAFDGFCSEEVEGQEITNVRQLRLFIKERLNYRRLVIYGVDDNKKSGVTYDPDKNIVNIELF